MTSRRRCDSPCPGCGAKGKYRYKDSVCDDCKAVFKEVEVLRASLAKREDKRKTSIFLSCPDRGWSHWLPYIPHQGERNAIQDAFLDLVHAVGDRVSYRRDEQYATEIQHIVDYNKLEPVLRRTEGSLNNPIFAMPRGSKDALEALYTAILKLAHYAYSQGKKDGANLLTRLHQGDITLAELEEAIDIKPFKDNRG